jgi:hypothetical protein
MHTRKRHAVAALAAVSVLGGCAHERIAWPPKPAEVAEISHAAYDELFLHVDFVDPAAARREVGELDQLKLKGIVWLDDTQIIFREQDDDLLPVQAEKVRSLTVKDRDRGGFIGALGGTAAMSALVLGYWYLFGKWGNSPLGPADCTFACDNPTLPYFAAIGAVGGALLGYMISGKRTYEFVPAR